MYVNVAVLKETHPHERRVVLVPGVIAKLVKLWARLHMQTGAGEASGLADADYQDVTFIKAPLALVAEADVVLAVQVPSLKILGAMKAGAILVSFVYAQHVPERVQVLLDRRITCFAMERIPPISLLRAWTHCPASQRWPVITPCS